MHIDSSTSLCNCKETHYFKTQTVNWRLKLENKIINFSSNISKKPAKAIRYWCFFMIKQILSIDMLFLVCMWVICNMSINTNEIYAVVYWVKSSFSCQDRLTFDMHNALSFLWWLSTIVCIELLIINDYPIYILRYI